MMRKSLLFTALFFFYLLGWREMYGQSCTTTAQIPINGSITVNGVKVTSSSSGYVTQYPYSWPGGAPVNACINASSNSMLVGATGYETPTQQHYPAPWTVILTFDKPVNELVLLIAAAGTSQYPNGNEVFNFVSNSGTISISSTNSCHAVISGNKISAGARSNSQLQDDAGGAFKISSTSAFTQLTMSGPGGYSGSLLAICQASIKEDPCGSFTTIPAVKNLSFTCPESFVNLNTSHTGNIPSGASLAWYKSNTQTPLSGTQITQASEGSYFAYYYNSSTGCYSPASSPVLVSKGSCADLQISKTISNPTPKIGQNVTFTISVQNNGPNAATGVVVNEQLPSGYTFVNATSSLGNYTIPIWNIGNLSYGASATLSLVCKVNALGGYINTATIVGIEADSDSGNNTASVSASPLVPCDILPSIIKK